MDTESIREYFSKLSEKYGQRRDSRIDNSIFERINRGIESIDEIRDLTDCISTRVEKGHKVIDSTRTLVRSRVGEMVDKD